MSNNKYTVIKHLFAEDNKDSSFIHLDKSFAAYKKIINLIEKPVKLILFYGNPGCGKTFLLKKVVEDLKDREDIVFFSYPFFNENEFMTSLYEEIFKEKPIEKIQNYEEFTRIYKSKFNQENKKVFTVLLDEAQLYPELLIEKLRLLSDSGFFKFLFAIRKTDEEHVLTKDYFKARIWESIEMSPLEVNEMRVYMESKLQSKKFDYQFLKFTDEQLELINNLTRGSLTMLNRFMFNFFELYEYFEDNQPTIISTDTMSTKILEMAAIRSELINA
ncbi:ATP-binding protein [Campylobacter sp. CCUG 57310]|uniref:ATP-binding protein n=1 Tax=Campylobacter sp. CCUG 57310 TaxID=2517362 RepID=UPI0015644BA5|nr:ATP-binding protein [Campylobacter sp. CCUG 57310]QKF92279.1 ATP-binding protein (AAA domain) [Campylobacter sp. CCUG 57310]